MILDAIGVLEVQKPILFLIILCGVDLLPLMLPEKRCLSQYLLTDNKILSRILIIGIIMIQLFKSLSLITVQSKEELKLPLKVVVSILLTLKVTLTTEMTLSVNGVLSEVILLL
jgi:hypothetical protein